MSDTQSSEHPFDVDAVTRALLAHKPAASVSEIAEIAVAALSDRLTTLNRYREALEHIAQHGVSLDSAVAREALGEEDRSP